MEQLLKQIRRGITVVIILTVLLLGLSITLVFMRIIPKPTLFAKAEVPGKENKKPQQPGTDSNTGIWKAPEISLLKNKQEKELVEYGRDLIANTAKYFGPQGVVGKLTNGMNCQNCHMDAGTKPFGNNYSAVYSTYPKFRARSGTNESIVKRISDCFERSLNGIKPDSSSKEIKAMLAYIRFLGTEVKKGIVPKGAGLEKLAYLERAADPVKGKLIYQSKCATCHGAAGAGLISEDKKSYTYPPLWGQNSYNDAAGLFRISNFAGYVKNNMPFGASYENQILSNEEAWDVAAFVNDQPRPHKDQQRDWVDLSKKPVDFPFGPYADKFTEMQHKFGPYEPIKNSITK
ncbi:c-type cytochrome [Pedobacter nototheniae]|uniref:c-type cytochrome n=1 Tax=Pedobacter nototheniae TaxID=2488994 RepID=UPI00292F9CAD|nr:c-type cytochrome [Pedobacter nototheniae]